MSTAEILPDKINMINSDGDIVPAIDELHDAPETYYSPNFYKVRAIINAGIDASRNADGQSVMVRPNEASAEAIWLGQYLAGDLYKSGLSADERAVLLAEYAPVPAEVPPVRRALGNEALNASVVPDVRMRAAADDTYKD